jgi:peptidoglycan-associated lipoprotein
MTKRTIARTTHMAMLATLVVALAACSSPVKLDEPPVESRTVQPLPSGSADPNTAANASGTSQSQVATVNTGGAGAAAALSQRIVYFDYDSFALRDDSKPVVEAHAKVLTVMRSKRMTVEGHTDERGGREYNLALGQKRAEAVVKSLALLGANEAQLEAVSFGKERPAVAGVDEATWAKNRRAELKDKQ